MQRHDVAFLMAITPTTTVLLAVALASTTTTVCRPMRFDYFVALRNCNPTTSACFGSPSPQLQNLLVPSVYLRPCIHYNCKCLLMLPVAQVHPCGVCINGHKPYKGEGQGRWRIDEGAIQYVWSHIFCKVCACAVITPVVLFFFNVVIVRILTMCSQYQDWQQQSDDKVSH